MKSLRIGVCFLAVFLLMSVQACNLPGSNSSNSDAEKTLMAIYVEQTVSAVDANQPKPTDAPVVTDAPAITEAPPTENPIIEPTPTKEIIHTTIPAGAGYISQYWMDTNTSSVASEKRAYGGENYSANLYERPFTAMDMVYHPDVDLVRVELSADATFFYFNLFPSGINPDQKMLTGNYGVEFDFDRDGRGDLLLWVLADGNTNWNIDNVFVYRDTNNDVGGKRPMQTEAPNYVGDSYDQVVFSPDHLDDPDAAWKRINPQNPGAINLAIKKTLLDNKASFMWNGWADGGVMDPAKFDYNDTIALADAGSPYSGMTNYPVKALFLVDNTCRIAFGFTPTGLEIGGCVLFAPTPVLTDTNVPPTVVPLCNCSNHPSTYWNYDPTCCVYCGFNYYYNSEFPLCSIN